MDHEPQLKHKFNIQEIYPTPSSVKIGFQTGIANVWNKLMGNPTTFNITFAKDILDGKTMKNSGRTAEYDPTDDMFLFGLETMRSAWTTGLSEEDLAFLIGAHEGTHKVQFAREGAPKPSPTSSYINHQDYLNDKFEEEAWNEAIQAFKLRRPDINIQIGLSGGKKNYSSQ
jgi:hypothetical protein